MVDGVNFGQNDFATIGSYLPSPSRAPRDAVTGQYGENPSTGNLAAVYYGADPVYYDGDLVVVGSMTVAPRSPQFGSLTDNNPVTIHSTDLAGFNGYSFFDDFYNRLYLLPASLDFGAVSTDDSRTEVIWNAHLVSRTLTGITSAGSGATSLYGISAPTVFGPLETYIFRVDATLDGPIEINVTYSFAFDNGKVLALPVTGTRARVWSYAPNWTTPVRYASEFKSEVLTSRNGTEQRRALRSSPRTSVTFSSLVKRDVLTRLRADMTKWQNRLWAMPDWVNFAPTTVAMPSFGLFTRVAEVPDWMTPGTQVLLVNGTSFTGKTVDSVTGNEVKFTSPGPLAWPAGTRVYRALSGYLRDQVQLTLATDAVGTVAVDFQVLPGSQPEPPQDWSMWLHAGREVLVQTPNRRNDISQSLIFPKEQIDYGFGRIQTFRPTQFASRSTQAVFLGMRAEASRDLVGYFMRAKGQRGDFYAPTWEDDLPLVGDLEEGSSILRVRGPEIALNFDGDLAYRALVVQTRDGRHIFRSISAIFETVDDLGHDTGIEVDHPWMSDIQVGQIARVSWMLSTRYASDLITQEWLTDTVSQTQVTLATIKHETPDPGVPEYTEGQRWLLEVFGWPVFQSFADPLQYEVNIHYPNIVRSLYSGGELPVSELDEGAQWLIISFGATFVFDTWLPTADILVNYSYPQAVETA